MLAAGTWHKNISRLHPSAPIRRLPPKPKGRLSLGRGINKPEDPCEWNRSRLQARKINFKTAIVYFPRSRNPVDLAHYFLSAARRWRKQGGGGPSVWDWRWARAEGSEISSPIRPGLQWIRGQTLGPQPDFHQDQRCLRYANGRDQGALRRRSRRGCLAKQPDRPLYKREPGETQTVCGDLQPPKPEPTDLISCSQCGSDHVCIQEVEGYSVCRAGRDSGSRWRSRSGILLPPGLIVAKITQDKCWFISVTHSTLLPFIVYTHIFF